MAPHPDTHTAASDAAKGRTLLERRRAPITIRVNIKNTFIELPNDDYDECAPFVRCSSEPQLRNSPVAADAKAVLRTSPVATTANAVQSDASTEASSGEEDVPAVPTPKSPAVNALVWVAGATPLRVSARPWEPPPAPLATAAEATAPSASAASRKFRKQLRATVRKVEAALSQCSCIGSVEACESSEGGWSITVRIRPQDLNRKEATLTCAKEALLHAATESTQLYVLGYKARPFTATADGFAATVGCVRDEAKACWFAVGQGFCRQEQCQWQHPLSETSINVAVVLDMPREHAVSPATSSY